MEQNNKKEFTKSGAEVKEEQGTQKKRKVLVTGGAGFIGSHLVDSLLLKGDQIVVLDNFNEFYSPEIKRNNIINHLNQANYSLVEGDLRDKQLLESLFLQYSFDVVVHLAAMAGVRPSMQNPALYMDINLLGTQRLIDCMVSQKSQARLVFGSSSSVYGERAGESFSELDRVDNPLSPYAASKAAGELLCYAAHHTRGLAVMALRFFTVFGPRQRPDLAIHKFSRLIADSKPIEIYGDGSSKRDYTYVADIVYGIEQAMTVPFSGYEIVNLGRAEPVVLMDLVHMLEEGLGKKAKIEYKEFQTGDMPYTYANIEKAKSLLSYEPNFSFEKGIENFIQWFISLNALAKK